jgi:alkylation response protein AidB-like acyl-CoA dehydrogenase
MKDDDRSYGMSNTHLTHRGGDWLLGDIPATDVFTPEKLSDEHRLVRQTAAEFVANEVFPALDELEKKNWGRARDLMKRAGELGLIGTDVPERFGGVGLDKVAAIVVGEEVGACAAFATTFGAQTGLAIIPILCFGTPAQQQKYLPRIVSAEILGAYCLSESGSGSDALGARARASRQPDGSWILNGEKMWTTNGGFADFFIVFAKVDGEQFSAFIVERGFPGVTSGKEEHKMGLHGSSTTPLLLADARVPADNLLGEIGKGHKIAFNVLNYGRFKLAAMCTGGAKLALAEAAAYASSRRQFGQPIASFGAIRHKLAEMAIRCYGVESMLYRTAGLVDDAIGSSGSDPAVVAGALEEFAIESSLLKVAGSEMIGFVADENVQIHGGNGFVRDYSAERHYRDVRVDRIFEGTNEINRLLVPGMLIKRALKGGLPLIAAARALQDELLTPRAPAGPASGGTAGDAGDPLAVSRQTVQAMKKTALMVLGLAMQTYGDKLADEQEVVMLASDVIMGAFAADSATLRAEHARQARDPLAALHADAAAVLTHDAGLAADTIARTAISAMTSGDEQRTMLAALKRILKVGPVNTVAARRRVADAVTERKKYVFA